MTACPMTAVISSNVEAVGYDQSAQELHVKFHYAHRVYVYRGVPVRLYYELLGAPSKGRFLNRAIRGQYPHRLVAS